MACEESTRRAMSQGSENWRMPTGSKSELHFEASADTSTFTVSSALA
jgi:hypothetical protein